MENKEKKTKDSSPMKSLLVLYSYHHHNTEKIAKIIAKVLDAEIKTPQQIKPEELLEYDLLGFGSGIYSAKHHESLLELADELPQVTGREAFLFSTSGMTGDAKAAKDHATLKKKLELKGYILIDEFQCKGFNTNSFLKLFGGMNKGRPNAHDLKNAEDFIKSIKRTQGS
ncbi:MAG: flavodoxin family protein [Methanobacteriaceae archaeon]|nr:flavodoxin family protein [Methanobacteriaceae archaeon]